MPKFALFSGPNTRPDQELQGDYMTQDGQYVKVFKSSPDPTRMDLQVGAFHLDKGQTVKQLD